MSIKYKSTKTARGIMMTPRNNVTVDLDVWKRDVKMEHGPTVGFLPTTSGAVIAVVGSELSRVGRWASPEECEIWK